MKELDDLIKVNISEMTDCRRTNVRSMTDDVQKKSNQIDSKVTGPERLPAPARLMRTNGINAQPTTTTSTTTTTTTTTKKEEEPHERRMQKRVGHWRDKTNDGPTPMASPFILIAGSVVRRRAPIIAESY